MRPPLSGSSDGWVDLEADVALRLAAYRETLAPILDHSPYLSGLIQRHPEVAARCLDGDGEGAFADAIGDEVSIAKRLRLAKQRVALICALTDLTGLWPTMQVTARLADFADAALEIALAEARRGLVSRGKMREGATGIGIVAMGKHGAGELNYSSDIDIIVLFDPDDATFVDRDEALDAAVRVTREIVRLMQERDADGYVFRTDLRLRPDPSSMPLAIPLAMAESYYETRGQNWERAAWIKARHAAGDRQVTGEAFTALRPFVWRRYLDFAAIADIHSIKRQIQAHRDILDLTVPGHNVKLGRGGIREIEFFVQTQQLIAGGRDERLRGRGTLDMLAELARTGWIEPAAADEMTASYLLLRDVEHRLQMVDDRQTHTLSDEPDELAGFARFCGFEAYEPFATTLRDHLVRTEAHYASLFADEPELGLDEGNLAFTGDDPDPGTVRTLEDMGFARPADMIAVVKGWHYGRHSVLRSSSARERLTEIVPNLLRTFGARADPDAALLSFDTFLAGLPTGVQLFALLDANPKLTGLLLDILSDAPRMAALIQRRAYILDAIVEPRFFDDLPDGPELEKLLTAALDRASDYEDMLDRGRIFAAEQRLLVSIRLLGGSIDATRAGEAYSLLAETVLVRMLNRVQADFARRHGHIVDGRIAIVAMGRLGSRELTASSDLDLVFITDRPDANTMSDGEKPLAASHYEMRLVQKLVAAMNAPTAEGRLYELDFRLRPSGNSGPLATTLRSFRDHQLERAKVWEHLALTRARPIAGDATLCLEIERTVENVLERSRERGETAHEVRDMRRLMDEERPGGGSLDVKLAPGGLVDLEFVAQFGVLAGLVPVGLRHEGPAALLEAMAEPALADDYRFLSTILQTIRLGVEREDDPLPSGLLERMIASVGEPDIDRFEARLAETRTRVRSAFERLV